MLSNMTYNGKRIAKQWGKTLKVSFFKTVTFKMSSEITRSQ